MRESKTAFVMPKKRFIRHYYYSMFEKQWYLLITITNSNAWQLMPVDLSGKKNGPVRYTSAPLNARQFANKPFQVEAD